MRPASQRSSCSLLLRSRDTVPGGLLSPSCQATPLLCEVRQPFLPTRRCLGPPRRALHLAAQIAETKRVQESPAVSGLFALNREISVCVRFNPSSPSTVPQPSYRPITPTTPSTTPSTPSTAPNGEVTSPAHEEPPSTTARSELPASVAKTRSIHHHRGRSTLVTYSCGYLGCVRTYARAFPCQYYSRYCYPYGYYRPYGWYHY